MILAITWWSSPPSEVAKSMEAPQIKTRALRRTSTLTRLTDTQKLELAESEVVQRYLAAMNRSADDEEVEGEDFS